MAFLPFPSRRRPRSARDALERSAASQTAGVATDQTLNLATMAPASSQSQDEGRTSEGETDGAPLHPSEAAIAASLDEQLELQRKNLAELRLILENHRDTLQEEADEPAGQATASATGRVASIYDPTDTTQFTGQVELLQQKIYEAIERAGASPEDDGFAAALHAVSPSSAKPPKKTRGPSPEVTHGTQSKGKNPANQAIQPSLPTALTHPINASYKKPVIFYRVACSDLDPKCNKRLYLDSPQYKQGHLTGDRVVSDLEQFLKQRENPPFVVYRAFQCSGSGFVTTTQKTSPAQTDEVVFILNKDLLSIIKRLSKFTFDFLDDKISISGRNDLYKMPALYPHYFLYHHRREIYSKASGASEGSPIKLFAQWLQSVPIPMYAECDNLFSKRLVSAATLCWLFPINGLCIVDKGHRKLGYVVDGVGMDKGAVILSAWNWGFNGQWVFRIYTVLRLKNTVSSTKVSMKIEDLGVYPIGYGPEDISQQLLEKGAKFWKLKDQGFHAYEGWDYKRETYYTADSRWMIDYDLWLEAGGRDEYAKNPKVNPRKEYDNWGDDLPASLEPSAVQQMLLPQAMHAYNTKELKWMLLSVDQIRPVAWNKDAFNRLILPQRTKSILKGLVMTKKPAAKPPVSTETQQDRANFLVSRNGRPLIMHFHGGPGTGKSFAAESLAELAEMPVFRVACGMIGTTYDVLSESIRRSLRWADKWKSIVLFDNLDVFLDRRSGSDSEYNRLASAFFEGIACHDGIIILTSSDAQSIDSKYASRCQLNVSFPPLDKPARRSVWKHCLDQLRAESGISCAQGIQSHLAALSSHQLNGKQIHHALTTARQMAQFEKSKLEFKHLKDAIEMATDSDRQLE